MHIKGTNPILNVETTWATGNYGQIRLGYTGGTDRSITGHYDNGMTFDVNGERMRIDTSGNVGIGTTSPSHTLTVAGDGLRSYGTISSISNGALLGRYSGGTGIDSGELILATDAKTGWDEDVDEFGRIRFYSTDSSGIGARDAAVIKAVNGFGDGSNTVTFSGELAFFTSAYNANVAEAVRIDSSGNVGIGTTSPASGYKLDVRGNILAYYANVVAQGLVSGYGLSEQRIGPDGTSATSKPFVVYTSGGFTNERLRIDTSGNVGIGTTVPTYKLDVNGGIRTSSVTGPGVLDLVAPTSFLRFQANANNIFYDAGGNHYFRTASGASTSMIVTSAGNVGIGTTSPFGKLNVSRPGINEGAISFDDQANNAHLVLAGTDALVRMQLGTYNNGSYGAWIQGSYDNGGVNYGPLPLILNPQGENVGIGTTSPSHKLDVNGDIAVKGASIINRASAALVIGDIAGTDSVTNLTLTTAGRNTEVFLDDSGNVGINDTTPSYALDVTGTIRATGDVIAYSDARVKENVETIPNALDKVKAMRGVGYNKIGSEERSIGVIAQEMLDVMPEVVHTDDQGMHSVAYGNLVGVLIEAMKEQQAQIDELKAIIANR